MKIVVQISRLTLWVSLFNCMYMNSQNSSTATIHVQELIMFMKLQAEKCIDFSFCTAIPPQTTTIKRYRKSCCLPCYCDDNCHVHHRCCPDIWLFKNLFNNSSPFQRIEDLEIAVDKYYNKSQEMEVEQHPTLQPNEECVSNKLALGLTTVDTGSREVSYSIISKCDLLNARNTRNSCGTLFGSNDNRVYIPVISKTTDKVYKNVFCAECNQDDLDLVSFEIYVTFNTKQIDSSLFFKPDTLFSKILDKRLAYKNIIIRPPEAFQHVVRKCAFSDISVCSSDFVSENTSWDQKMCELLYLPIIIDQNYHLIFFKNIACVNCSNDTLYTYDPICKHFFPPIPESRVQLNLLENPSSHTTVKKEIFFQEIIDRVPINWRVLCNTSSIFDKQKQHCRQLHCPKLWHNSDDSCVLTLTKFENVYISVNFRIGARRNSKIKTALSRSQLQHVIETTALSHFSPEYAFELNLGQTSRTAYVLLIHTQDTGGQMLYKQLLQSLKGFQNALQHSLHTNIQTHTLLVEFTNADLTSLKRQVIFSYGYIDFQSRAEFELSKAVVCPRVALHPSEVAAKKGVIFVYTSNKTISYHGFQIHEGLFYICADSYFVFPTVNIRNNILYGDLNMTKTYSLYRIGYTAFFLILVPIIVIILIGARIILHHWKRE